MDRTRELEEQVRKLSATIEEMRGRLSRLEDEGDAPAGDARSSRRNFLRLGGAAAAGALGLAASRVLPVAAANGDTMTVAGAMSGTSPTSLTGSPFQGIDTSFSSTNFTTALSGESFNGPLQSKGGDDGTVPGADGLEGFASGPTSFGVWGLTDTGTGVTGQANTGIGLYARGTGRIRQDPQAPNYPPNLMEQVRDANGVLWIHNATGVWRRVNTLRTDASDNSGNVFIPFRLYDSRSGAKPAKGSKTTIQVANTGSGASTIPADAVAVVGNLTATGYTGAGYISIVPTGAPAPSTSSVNFITGQGAIANAFVVGLGGSPGSVDVYVSNNVPSHFLLDITAYIQ
jgi:hypothetical protein